MIAGKGLSLLLAAVFSFVSELHVTHLQIWAIHLPQGLNGTEEMN